MEIAEDAQRLEDEARDDGHPRELPEAVVAAANGEVREAGEQELAATEWLLTSDIPTDDEVAPTTIRLNVGTPLTPKFVLWRVVPLPDSEFKRFRKLAMGSRRTRRAIAQGDITELDEWRYHLLVVTAATVEPDLKEVARQKGIADVSDVLRHRFRHKPMLINQISGIVSDISGADEADAEVVAGNS